MSESEGVEPPSEPAARPTVSVAVIAYNHEKFIARALDRILAQEVSFPFEVVLGEDCSTDRTREIIARYQQRDPQRVRVVTAAKNVGLIANVVRTLRACRGRYIALQDGDDYWTSPHKLQTQVDFLEAHPECSICFHNVEVVYDDGREDSHPFHADGTGKPYWLPTPKPVSTLADVIARNMIPTCSAMFRADALEGFPEWYLDFPVGDWPLFVLLAQRGDIGYIPQTMGAYRQHAQGYWTGQQAHGRSLESVEWVIGMHRALRANVDRRYRRFMNPELAPLYRRAMKFCTKAGDLRRAGKYAGLYLSVLPPREWLRERQAIRTLLRSRVSGLLGLGGSLRAGSR